MSDVRRTGLSVIVAGGGTAGHIEPALAVADALRALDGEIRVTALGTERGLETRLVPERGYPLELVPPVPLPRKPTVDLLRLPGRVRASVRRTREIIDATEADVIVGFGGYVALPAYLAAGGGLLRRRRRVPVVVHEANAKAGIANKVGARLARRVLAAVSGSGLTGAEVVGIPVRASITGLDRAALRAEARAHFGLPAEGPVLLVFGGSQGARSLNEAVAGAAPQLIAAGISVLHAHGPKNTLDLDLDHSVLGRLDSGPTAEREESRSLGGEPAAPVAADTAAVLGRLDSGLTGGCDEGVPVGREESRSPGREPAAPAAIYTAVPYLSRMDLAYAAADAVVCRSGAMTVAEVSAVGLPAFYVPLPHGNGEQELNARPVVAAGGGTIVPDAELTPEYVIDEVIPLLLDPTGLARMGRDAADAGHRDAAATVARIVTEAAR